MDWKDYRRRYSAFISSLQQTEMIFFHAAKAIPDTPPKVSQTDKSEVPFFVNQARRSISKLAAKWKTDHQLLNIESVVQLVFGQNKERILAYHELTMLIAHLEAFLVDTFRMIWHNHPEILEKTTQVGRRAVSESGVTELSFLSTDELEAVSSRAVFELMRKSSDAYMAYLREKLKLPIETDRKLLYKATLDRNAIVHNAGLISQEKYLDKLNKKERQGLRDGDPVEVDARYVVQISNLIQSLGEAVFEEVSKKYFKVDLPLKAHERAVPRQDPELQENPLEAIASEAIANIGGPDAVAANLQKAKAEMMRLLKQRATAENDDESVS